MSIYRALFGRRQSAEAPAPTVSLAELNAVKAELVIAKSDACYWEHVAELRAQETYRLLDLDLAGRILPDVNDETDLMVPTWPFGDAPIFDDLKAEGIAAALRGER